MKEFWKRQLLYCLSIFVSFSICYVFQKSGILLILKKKKNLRLLGFFCFIYFFFYLEEWDSFLGDWAEATGKEAKKRRLHLSGVSSSSGRSSPRRVSSPRPASSVARQINGQRQRISPYEKCPKRNPQTKLLEWLALLGRVIHHHSPRFTLLPPRPLPLPLPPPPAQLIHSISIATKWMLHLGYHRFLLAESVCDSFMGAILARINRSSLKRVSLKFFFNVSRSRNVWLSCLWNLPGNSFGHSQICRRFRLIECGRFWDSFPASFVLIGWVMWWNCASIDWSLRKYRHFRVLWGPLHRTVGPIPAELKCNISE